MVSRPAYVDHFILSHSTLTALSHPSAANLSWSTLSRLNEDLAGRFGTLRTLAEQDPSVYEEGLRWFAGPKVRPDMLSPAFFMMVC